MILGIGVDVCEVERLRAALVRRPGLADKLFTQVEADGRSTESLAARFAAKEALAKAMGEGVMWRDAEVVNDPQGRPRMAIRGTVAARAERLGITRIHVSLSHDAGIATAFVVCEGEP